jgi:hypothetical protein
MTHDDLARLGQPEFQRVLERLDDHAHPLRRQGEANGSKRRPSRFGERADDPLTELRICGGGPPWSWTPIVCLDPTR